MTRQPDIPKVSALILAGGRGSRFGYQDKGWLQWHHKALIEHIIERLLPQCQDIVISCNRNRDRYDRLGYSTVVDTLGEFQGPLAGMASGLPSCRHELVLTVPCDTPLVSTKLVERLAETLIASDKQLVYAWDGSREQYLFALMKRGLSEHLTAYLTDGGRSVHGWYQQLDTATVDFTDQADSFSNINSAKDLEQLPGSSKV